MKNLKSVYKNSDDEPIFIMGSDEKFFNVFEKIYQITWDSKSWMYTRSTVNIPTEALNQFQNGKSLFIDCTSYVIPSLRAMDTDFVILPYPKWEEAQEVYYSRIEGCELFCIPVTNKRLEMTGVILESLACESAKSVIDAYIMRYL